MLFLIQYARHEGRIITFTTFTDRDVSAAQSARLKLELDLNRRGVEHEVVLLEAATEEAVRRTHRRYFEDLKELANVS